MIFQAFFFIFVSSNKGPFIECVFLGYSSLRGFSSSLGETCPKINKQQAQTVGTSAAHSCQIHRLNSR